MAEQGKGEGAHQNGFIVPGHDTGLVDLFYQADLGITHFIRQQDKLENIIEASLVFHGLAPGSRLFHSAFIKYVFYLLTEGEVIGHLE